MSVSFGARLRRQRENQHITVAHIASVTKIQASLFEGLERDDVSRWPSGIFRRAFIRTYADQIGLDPEAVCREFLERFPEPGGRLLESPAVTPAGRPAVVATPPARVAAPAVRDESPAPMLRLTFADTPLTHAAARWLPFSAARGVALVCDALVPTAIALAAFVLFERFWMPLAVAALVYCLGSLLIMRTTPSLWLLTSGWRVAADTTEASTLDDDTIVYQPDMDSRRVRA